MEQIVNETYDYDDVLIYPLPSKVSSRDDVDISVKLSDNLTLKFPLIASPMVGVVDGAFAKKLSKLGGMAILHRFYKTHDNLLEDIKENLSTGDTFGISINIEDKTAQYVEILTRFEPAMLLIDTANGYTNKLLERCESIKKLLIARGHKALLMAGNVATLEGCEALYNAGCDIIRVGIGGGSPCSTRNVTGIGVPNISALMEADATDRKYKICVDGGIRSSGDLVKAIVAGADFGMSGKLFAECYEAPCKDALYGMVSRTHMANTKAEVKSVEGYDIPIEKKHSLEQFVKEFGYGIKSAGTYLNARSLDEIYVNGKFIKVSNHAIMKISTNMQQMVTSTYLKSH